MLLCIVAFALSLPPAKGSPDAATAPAAAPVGSVWLLTCACAIFRCDVILLAGPYLLMMLVTRRIRLVTLLLHGIAASLFAVGMWFVHVCDTFFFFEFGIVYGLPVVFCRDQP